MVREYRAEDLPAMRRCLVELQDFERELDPRLPPGSTMVDAYLDGLARRCEKFAGRLFVAEAEGRVIGFVSVLGACHSDAPDDARALFAYVDDLVVLPEYRGRGYGQALLRRAEEYGMSYGRPSMRLRVKAGNRRARVFYDRSGYSEYELELEKRLTR